MVPPANFAENRPEARSGAICISSRDRGKVGLNETNRQPVRSGTTRAASGLREKASSPER